MRGLRFDRREVRGSLRSTRVREPSSPLSVPLCGLFLTNRSAFVARTVQHQLDVTFGLDGSINYRAYDVTPSTSSSDVPSGPGILGSAVNLTQKPPILTYEAFGDMGDQASVKFGQYRAVVEGLEDVTTFVGDCERPPSDPSVPRATDHSSRPYRPSDQVALESPESFALPSLPVDVNNRVLSHWFDSCVE